MFQGLVTPDEGQEQEAQRDDRTDGRHVVQKQVQMGEVQGKKRSHGPAYGDQVGEQAARGHGTGPREDRGDRQETDAAADLALIRRAAQHMRADRHQGGDAGDDQAHLDQKRYRRAPVCRALGEEQDAGREIDDQADRYGREDPAEGGQRNVSADAEQTQVEHPAGADQHRHSHCVKRQHGRERPHRGRLAQPYRERSRFKPDQHTHG